MKILVATPIYDPDIGGPATHLKEVVPHFLREGDEVSLVTFADSSVKSGDTDIPITRVSRRRNVFARLGAYFMALWRRRDVDLYYVHDMSSVGLAAYLVSLFSGVPYVIRLGGDFVWEQAYTRGDTRLSYRAFQRHEPFSYRLRRHLGTMIVRRAKKVIVPSAFLGDIVSLWGVSEDRINVVHNAVTTPSSAPEVGSPIIEEMRARRSRGERVVMSSGRFVSWKHFDALFDALPYTDGTHLFLIGSGPDEGAYKAHLERHMLDERVTLLPSAPSDVHNAMLREADCYVLLSEGETFSFAALEALMAGTPVVLLKEGALPEIFSRYERRGVTFVPSHEAHVVGEVLRAADRLARPDESVREDIAKTFDIKQHRESVRTILMGVVQNTK